MSGRTPIVAGNWKMNTTRESGVKLMKQLSQSASDYTDSVQVVVFPPSVYLDVVRSVMDAGHIAVGAQNFYPEPDGAFTGEISVSMLKDLHLSHVLVGHSERRHVLGEPNELIRQKTSAALTAELQTFLCVGETIEQREAGQTDEVNDRQLTTALEGLDSSLLGRLTVAYEPVWAIGTGKTASPDDAQNAHAFIRSRLAELLGDSVAQAIRILYGGSVKASNATELFSMPDIDGGLVGGASLDAASFQGIIESASKTDAIAR